MSRFFDPSPLLGGPGNIQNATSASQRTLSHVSKPDGSASPCGSVSSGAKLGRTETYAVQEADGLFSVPAVGSISATGYHIDSVQVLWSSGDWPVVTISGHTHDGPSHPPVSRSWSPSIPMPCGWGAVPAYAGEGAVSVTYQLSCTHVEALDEHGNVFASDDIGAIETVEAGTQDGPLSSPGEGWTEESPTESADLSSAHEWGQRWQHPL